MLKQLLENRNFRCIETSFQQNVYEMQNCIEVLGIVAKSMQITDDQIIAGYIVDSRIFLKSMQYGQTAITLTDGINEAIVELFVHPSGEIVVEVKPYLGNAEIVLAYYRTILADTAIAIDLKGALKHYLVAHQLMQDEDSITEVHYRSMHPNVLKDSYAGNFTLGCHPNGKEITFSEEYTLANRVATLQFSKIVILQKGVKKIIALKMLLTFMITNHVFVSYENVNELLSPKELEVNKGELVLV
ncbi:hypothetical protein ACIQZG_06490 [Lysinibacillus sp. NPDC096418]|uniref:hypothetical protein n=1 Tax=Lysinibacillus sp. NPDC096418 TaxID=3364138 RepID=UPI0037FC7BEB